MAGTGFGYDPNGNLTLDGPNRYLYDIENRLVSRSGGGTSASLRYDPLGRLYEVTGMAGTTRFLHDGNALVAEYDAAGTMLRRYVHGDGAGADDPLVWFEGSGVGDGARRYLFADERGSVVAITDADGNGFAINAYDEYGIPAAGNSGRFQYTGQIWLAELGLYHYKARVYSPYLGRFLQTDPIGYEDGLNIYAYVANDPVDGVDPDGKKGVGLLLDFALEVGIQYGETGRVDIGRAVVETAKGALNPARTVEKLRTAGQLIGKAAKRCCFVAGTLVDTEQGLRPIDEIAMGDRVWARDEATGETALKAVIDLIRLHERVIWEVSLTGPGSKAERFETTDDHPWWIAGQGWKKTEELVAGMAVVTRDGRGMMLTSVVETDRTEPTYNLTVADFETYFVGEQRVWVHNCDLPKPPTGRGSVPREERAKPRDYTQPQRREMLERQDGKCGGTAVIGI